MNANGSRKSACKAHQRNGTVFDKSTLLPVPKKSKTEETNAATPAVEPVTSTVAARPAAAPKTRGAKKAAASKKSGGSKAAAKKSAARKSSKKSASKPNVSAQRGASEPSDEEIRIRAYFIAERRVQLSADGDPANDWIQAREELIAERTNGSANGNGSH